MMPTPNRHGAHLAVAFGDAHVEQSDPRAANSTMPTAATRRSGSAARPCPRPDTGGDAGVSSEFSGRRLQVASSSSLDANRSISLVCSAACDREAAAIAAVRPRSAEPDDARGDREQRQQNNEVLGDLSQRLIRLDPRIAVALGPLGNLAFTDEVCRVVDHFRVLRQKPGEPWIVREILRVAHQRWVEPRTQRTVGGYSENSIGGDSRVFRTRFIAHRRRRSLLLRARRRLAR